MVKLALVKLIIIGQANVVVNVQLMLLLLRLSHSLVTGCQQTH